MDLITHYTQSVYSQSSPCDRSRKQPSSSYYTTTIVKPRLNYYSNSVIKSSRKRPFPASISDRDHFWELPTGRFLCF